MGSHGARERRHDASHCAGNTQHSAVNSRVASLFEACSDAPTDREPLPHSVMCSSALPDLVGCTIEMWHQPAVSPTVVSTSVLPNGPASERRPAVATLWCGSVADLATASRARGSKARLIPGVFNCEVAEGAQTPRRHLLTKSAARPWSRVRCNIAALFWLQLAWPGLAYSLPVCYPEAARPLAR